MQPDRDLAGGAGAQAPRPIEHPFADVPPTGRAIEVAPGVLWIRMPLPYTLDHVNVWALADGAGWTVVDCGVHDAPTRAAWETLFEGDLAGRPVTRVIVTHHHADHVGSAGWLAARFGCELWMTRNEYLQCQASLAAHLRPMPEAQLDFYRRAGWREPQLAVCRERMAGFADRIAPPPDRYRRIRDGDGIAIGAHRWQVVVGHGHSPEHACLVNAELKLLISGDQVLPRISSNVSVVPWEPLGDPLAEWNESLALFRDTLDDDLLVLPSHKTCFTGLHRRLRELDEEQATAQRQLLDFLQRGPCRTIDVFPALFKRPIDAADGLLMILATGESQAFLNRLCNAGTVRAEPDGAGVLWYRPTGADPHPDATA